VRGDRASAGGETKRSGGVKSALFFGGKGKGRDSLTQRGGGGGGWGGVVWGCPITFRRKGTCSGKERSGIFSFLSKRGGLGAPTPKKKKGQKGNKRSN